MEVNFLKEWGEEMRAKDHFCKWDMSNIIDYFVTNDKCNANYMKNFLPKEMTTWSYNWFMCYFHTNMALIFLLHQSYIINFKFNSAFYIDQNATITKRSIYFIEFY
jgi:hypothetical protein